MKKAFTLLELIFVIVLIGVLSGIAFYMNRPNYAQQDTQYVLLKLKEARYRAIGYDGLQAENCVDLNETAVDIKSNISPKNKMICFDGLGRPHDGNSTALSTLLPSDMNITFTKNTHSSTILLYKQSGYAIIKCNN